MKTAEWVSPKHPDKMCDQISDAILDYCLLKDKNARVAVETMGGHGKVEIMGEITMNGEIPFDIIEQIVYRITGDTNLEIGTNIVKQSSEIANGVDTGGAGDQGIMVGYACSENNAMIPQEKYLADDLGEFIYEKYPFDGKTQITLNDSKDIIAVVASFQNVSKVELEDMVNKWLDIRKQTMSKIYCNSAGDWKIGGFSADTGLTGRKLMVDNYGPQIPIGGGAFSGKDSTKVDRSGAYMARKIAVDLLRQENAKEVLVKLAYSIGVAEPVMAVATIDGKEILLDVERLTPSDINRLLRLREPQFEETAKRGHFGKGFRWDN